MQNGPFLIVILPGLFFKVSGLYLSWGKVRSASKRAAQAVEAIETHEASLTSDPAIKASCNRSKGRTDTAWSHDSLQAEERRQPGLGKDLGAEKHICVMRYCHSPSPTCLQLCDTSTLFQAIQPALLYCILYYLKFLLYLQSLKIRNNRADWCRI